MNNLSKITNHFISRSKIIIWLALHGCDVKELDFFPQIRLTFINPSPHPKKEISLKSIIYQISRIKITGYYRSLIAYSLDKCYKTQDWKDAKHLSSLQYVVIRHPWEETYTMQNLDDMPY